MIEEQIVGKWKWYTITYNFRSDGTYDYENTDSGIKTNGRYAISGEELIFFINSPVRSKFSLEGDILTIYPKEGNTATFMRMT
ncbi:MAG: hypothetical protein LBH95_08650 [Oscillospiraceae bacterium]|nr:hypothetical protein [Oscillospiraceae bacterium]